ncbi:uncharacterized protein DDB_G0289917 isoform X1 [Drosophila tropicalis]|uniref:uncharacterized protein DDB_G0289917 isoform X1 n=1 Tax=Drosophila tropicalis TaxID=46794 RepID=UPI0035AC0AC6
MVLTNFECWAHGDSGANFEMVPTTRMTDPFNPRAVPSASNGYYGYAFVNDANNNNNNNNNNDNITSNNNAMEQCMAEVVTPPVTTVNRCKKRCGGSDADADATAASMDMDNYISAIKRCRYDTDADLAAQYCNDFFSLPATQIIGTQACLMDYDMDQQQQQHQQLQQQQLQAPRSIHQHYQDSDPTDEQSTDPTALKPLKNSQIIDSDEADLYIATHGGCLHHFDMLSGEHEEFDI